MTLEKAVEAVLAGELVGLPTDTVYGIGSHPLNDDAVSKLFDLKGRPEHKPIGLLVASLEQAEQVGEIHGAAHGLAARHWPGALTLVVTPKIILADWVGDAQRRTVGLRVPDHSTAIELLAAVGPLAVTSANRSGGPEAVNDQEARVVFGDRVAVYLEGAAPGGKSSTVLDVTGPEPVVLREGPVSV